MGTGKENSGLGCQVCGQPVRVRILERYQKGRPVLRHLCLGCADLTDRHFWERRTR